MTDYFLSFLKSFTTMISQQLSVLFLNIFFQPFLSCKWLITCHTHSLICSQGSMSSMSQNPFKCLWHLVAHQYLIQLIFHFIYIFTFIFWTAIFLCLFLIFLISTSSLFVCPSLYFTTQFLEVHRLNMGTTVSKLQPSRDVATY